MEFSSSLLDRLPDSGLSGPLLSIPIRAFPISHHKTYRPEKGFIKIYAAAIRRKWKEKERMRSTGYTYQLLVGQEYELEHKLEGRPVQESASEKLDNNCQVKGSTREKLAKEHGVSQGTVQRSADLYNSVKTISEVAPGCNNRSMDREGSHRRKAFSGCLFRPSPPLASLCSLLSNR